MHALSVHIGVSCAAYHQAVLHTGAEDSSAETPRHKCELAVARAACPTRPRALVSKYMACGRGRSTAVRGCPSYRPVVLAPVPPPPPAAVAGAAAVSAAPGAAPGAPPSAVSEMVPVTSDRSVKPMEWSMATCTDKGRVMSARISPGIAASNDKAVQETQNMMGKSGRA